MAWPKPFVQMLNQLIDFKCAQLFILLTCLSALIDANTSKELPDFMEPIQNISVPSGREAVLQCSVRNLGDYRVAWLQSDAETGTLLTLHNQVISKDSRIRITQSSIKNWNLHIKDVRESDRGAYMCQINTQPMISQVGYLDVLVPPRIIEEETSSDAIVDERSKLSIYCKASGYPSPTIIWRREDSRELNLGYYSGKKHSAVKVEGEHLNISQITREDMGAYLCIASNGVPPSVSKRISVQVNFRPKIRVNDQLIAVDLGSSVQLECIVEASPKPLTSWLRQDNLFLLPSAKYEISEEVNSYRIKMRLRIKKMENKDYSAYKCVAKNTLGEKEGYIRLFRPEVKTTPSTTTTTTTTTQSPFKKTIPPFDPKLDDYDIDGLSSNVHDIYQRGEYAHNPNRDFNMNLNNPHNPIYNSKNDLSNDVMMHQNTVNDLMRSGAKLDSLNGALFAFVCLQIVLPFLLNRRFLFFTVNF